MSTRLRLILALAVAGGTVTAIVPPTAQAATLSASLVATRSTSTWAQPSPDPSGIVWDETKRRLIISDSEVDEMPLYRGANLFVSSVTGVQDAAASGTTLPWSNEPTGVGFNKNTGVLFVSDDIKDLVFQVRAGADGRFGTDDDQRSSFSTASIGNGDPEDVAVDMEITPNGHLLVVDGRNKEVYEYAPGPDGVFNGIAPAGDDVVVQFDVYRHGARDPEGIAYHADRDTLLVLDGRTKKIYETTRRGELLNVISIGAANSVKAAGITVAPASDGSARKNLYIVDRGVDNNVDPNENDGRFYEMAVNLPPLPAGGGGAADFVVQTGRDDAEERSDGTALSGNLQLVVDRTRAQTVGLRFQGVSVPRGATITNAYVQFRSDATSTGDAAIKVRGQAADNAATFSTVIGDISSRPQTSEVVDWAPARWSTVGARGPDQRTPNLKSVIQEIVNRPGWASGNALALVLTGTGTRTADSYNTDAANAPLLHLEWTV